MNDKNKAFRTIPRMDKILASNRLLSLDIRQEILKKAAEDELSRIRNSVKTDMLSKSPSSDEIAEMVSNNINTIINSGLRPMINATGVIVYTNLGRAPLAITALEAIQDAAAGYSNLEYNVNEGIRGSRQDHIKQLARLVFKAEDALVVNNNAAAVMLVLASLAPGKEVIVSRGELVEIGGSFRMPDVMKLSGAILKEVGTTNKTRVSDYEKAINENTGLIMKVHKSNFAVVGFTDEADIYELSALADKNGLPLYVDMGSGIPFDLARFGINGEWTIPSCLAAGAAVVSFSGDKALSGPQAGIIVGRKSYITQMSRHPLHRALRIDKLSLAALIETLKILGSGQYDELPVLRMITEDETAVKKRASQLKRRLNIKGQVIKTRAVIGGGSAPSSTIPSYAIEIKLNDAVKCHARLRASGIVCRIEDDSLIFDLKTVSPEQIKLLSQRINYAVQAEE